MQLIGMLDSPYVRRVAISLQLLRVPFDHASISVFRTFAEFQQINPVVKAPTLVCDDGTVLMDSTLIIEYAEALADPRKSLMPADIVERQHVLRIIGLALAACEKSVQIIYERQLRPAEKLHEPWVARVTGQLLAAYSVLDSEIAAKPLAVTSGAINQAGISAAVAWHFTQQTLPEVVVAENFPALTALSSKAELLPAFLAAPHGAGTYLRVDESGTRTASEAGREAT
ncbi:MAG TPA: glutathione S-transferase [Burkholderiaceae bacterium]|nr:glutathione S-transferase [Burkholderiaceae bacterium]